MQPTREQKHPSEKEMQNNAAYKEKGVKDKQKAVQNRSNILSGNFGAGYNLSFQGKNPRRKSKEKNGKKPEAQNQEKNE